MSDRALDPATWNDAVTRYVVAVIRADNPKTGDQYQPVAEAAWKDLLALIREYDKAASRKPEVTCRVCGEVLPQRHHKKAGKTVAISYEPHHHLQEVRPGESVYDVAPIKYEPA